MNWRRPHLPLKPQPNIAGRIQACPVARRWTALGHSGTRHLVLGQKRDQRAGWGKVKRCWTPWRVAAACAGAKNTRDRQGQALPGGNPSFSRARSGVAAGGEPLTRLPRCEEREVAKVIGRILNKDLFCIKVGFPACASHLCASVLSLYGKQR